MFENFLATSETVHRMCLIASHRSQKLSKHCWKDADSHQCYDGKMKRILTTVSSIWDNPTTLTLNVVEEDEFDDCILSERNLSHDTRLRSDLVSESQGDRHLLKLCHRYCSNL